MFLYYSFDEFEMQKSVSLEKINGTDDISNAKRKSTRCNFQKSGNEIRRRHKHFRQVHEHYQIIIRPKIHRSNSLSDLTKTSDYSFDYFNNKNSCLYPTDPHIDYDCSGDTLERYSRCLIETPHMSWNFKGKKMKGKIDMNPELYASRLDYTYGEPTETEMSRIRFCSSCSSNDTLHKKNATFPFKPTPSGNLKVQSNQVVFQSSTVGVLLADPTQAKVKVKIEGNGEDLNNEYNKIINANYKNHPEPHLQYGHKTSPTVCHVKTVMDRNIKDKTKIQETCNLSSLGYGQTEPVDWTCVQLPKKQELFQEFYRRILNKINTDCIVHIGNEEFHCHRIVLEIYSSLFSKNPQREIELSNSNVKPTAFQIIYEWMTVSGLESNKLLKRENVLDLFAGSQYLGIKDLEDQCWSFIANDNIFNEDSAFVLYRGARVQHLTPVMELMVPRVKRFFLPLVASSDFLGLEPEEVMTFLKSNYICVASEIEVLMAGVRWLYGDWTSRKRFVTDVMRCVRFGLISPWQLVDIKRNPDNAEILEIVNEPDVQQMVDDGLAYVIIKYWYGNNSKNYYHWIDVLGLSEPVERNWIGEEKNHVTYKEFLKYLEQFMVPKEQMYKQMAMMQPPRRNDDAPGSFRGKDQDKMEMRRPKIDFPTPAVLMGLTDTEKFPTMSEFFGNQSKIQKSPTQSFDRAPIDVPRNHETRNSPEMERKQTQSMNANNVHEPPEKDSTEELVSSTSETSETPGTSATVTDTRRGSQKRHSVAACYLAAATAALSGNRRDSQSVDQQPQTSNLSRPNAVNRLNSVQIISSPQASLFNQSKESLAKANMNKLSTSILGPSNKNYIVDGSLFNWDRETVLVFGGIDPHTPYGVAGNTGKDIYRFDPVTNIWESVGELPEPRHHHSVAFLRGRVFLVGGADPREDDLRGKSVVVSTVWSYEPVTRSWFSESGLAIPRKNFGLVVHKMALYAIGGQDKKGRVLRSVEKFDPKTGSWSEVRSMGVARMAVATVKYRDYIWVAGGMTGEKKRPVCKIVECYNYKTNEWTEIHSLRFPRCFATLFSMNDKLYIIGGAGKMSDKDKTPSSVGAIDVWDWKERQWKQETEMSIPRHGHALAYLGTQLIIIGGVTTIYMRALSNVESFCCERGAWIRGVATLPTPLSGHGAVTLPPASLM
ncbi:uncharacterized protein LOC123719519 isoform X3 [Pieris brassicae]|uniref:uncharacterized protein LOC123719519 isoform X3 n=1 Tax=Pieris brassicae TaxID=7116 RepID=UPI001E65EE7E|nr:uncharacterized protein LOC123719519 isoform X3 [Pieris brassicae]